MRRQRAWEFNVVSHRANSQQIRQWIAELDEPQTRRGARYKLVAARAVDAFLECLDSTNESVVWAAIQSLGEMRAPEAIGPLVKLLDRDVLVLDVIESLARITGKDFGLDASAWKRWSQEDTCADSAEQVREELLRDALALVGGKLRGSGKTYEFAVSLEGGRKQKVIIRFGREDADGDELALVYSECGPADERHYEAVLRKNLKIPAGAFAIRDVKGTKTLVLVDTLLVRPLTPEQLAKSVSNIAARADLIEKGLTGEDRR